MFKPGLPELIVIFLAIILLFGAKALPDIARGLGEAIRNFKKSLREITEEETRQAPSDEENKS